MAKIRKFEPSDLSQIMKIAKVSFPENRFYPKTFEKYYRTYPDGFIVSEEMGEITGYVVGQFKDEINQVISLAVKPISRQKGIGTMLMNFLINHFKTVGLRELFLYVPTTNNNAVYFFQNLNFRILKTIKKYYQKRDDAFLMGRAI